MIDSKTPIPQPSLEVVVTIPVRNRIMFAALLPALIMSVVFFGVGSLTIMIEAVLSCLLFEYLLQKYLFKIPPDVRSGSAVITGILLAFNLPAGLPVWMVVLGSIVAIGGSAYQAGKMTKYPFHAVLMSRLLLRILFPVQMTTWPAVVTETDSLTGLTPLGMLKEGITSGKTISQITSDSNFPHYFDMFWGNVNGSLGEISVIAIIMGGLYLLSKKIITWHTPVAVLSSVFLFQGILWLVSSGGFMDPLFCLITGGITFMAFFMATDPATSPVTPTGKILAGIGIGLIIIIIRNFGAYPEEIFLAVLIMNGLTPWINTRTNQNSLKFAD